MKKIIIGIHGLSNKPKADLLSKGWELAIKEGLSKNYKIDNPNINFESVYWADVLYEEADTNADLYKEAESGAIKSYKENWLDHVREGIFEWGGDILDKMHESCGVNVIGNKILETKLPDLSKYYKDDNIQKELRKRLEKVILDNVDKKIMLISHSMGSIIAYDVLREIGRKYPLLVINHFITMGSPLGIPQVRYKISQENALVRTPTVVAKWSNFSDKRDPVAIDISLADDYEANDSGVQVKDTLVANDWGVIHHKSYGYLRTPEVSKVIRNFI